MGMKRNNAKKNGEGQKCGQQYVCRR